MLQVLPLKLGWRGEGLDKKPLCILGFFFNWYVVTVDHNKGFIIPTFCRPSADFEVVEDRLGSILQQAFVCLCTPR